VKIAAVDSEPSALQCKETGIVVTIALGSVWKSRSVNTLSLYSRSSHEYCGNRERHEYQLYLTIEDIDHSKTQDQYPQTNGICERFHRTIQNEFYAVAFRKKICLILEELQEDLDLWLKEYNEERTHSGKYCF